MARRRQQQVTLQTAEHTQADSVANNDTSDIFDGLSGATVGLILNISRTEPTSHAGYLGQINLAADQDHLLPGMIQERWGGGLFTVQVYQRSPNGKNKFGPAKRLHVAGEPRHPILVPPIAPAAPAPLPPQPVVAAAGQHHNPYYPGPPPGYPWPYPPQPAPALAGADPMAMFQKAMEIAQRTPATTAEDMAKIIASLSTTVRQNAAPEDPFSQLEKTIKMAQLLRSLNPKQEPAHALAGEEEGGGMAMFAELLKGILGQNKAPPPPQTYRIPPPPPGFALDIRTNRYVPIYDAQHAGQSPSAHREKKWEPMPHNREDAAEDEPDDDEEDDESDDEGALTAEQAFEEFRAMDVAEQMRLLQMVSQHAEQASTPAVGLV